MSAADGSVGNPTACEAWCVVELPTQIEGIEMVGSEEAASPAVLQLQPRWPYFRHAASTDFLANCDTSRRATATRDRFRSIPRCCSAPGADAARRRNFAALRSWITEANTLLYRASQWGRSRGRRGSCATRFRLGCGSGRSGRSGSRVPTDATVGAGQAPYGHLRNLEVITGSRACNIQMRRIAQAPTGT